jgi:hypothetical protein
MCVTNTVEGRARTVLFRQDEIYRVSSCAALNECTSASDKATVKACSKVCHKRRSHALPPGKTAKNHERQFVVHDYHDHSEDEAMNDRVSYATSTLFPFKLHAVLEEVANDGLGHIISWALHGRCFTVHKPKEFVNLVLPK